MTKALKVGAAALWCLAIHPQTKPDFSGNWVLDAAATAAANGGRGAGMSIPAEIEEGGAKAICGRSFTLTQTTDRLFIERQLADRSLAAAFKLDGTQTKHPILACRPVSKEMEREAAYLGAPTDMTTAVVWGSSTLTLQTVVAGGSSEVRQVLAIQTDNSLLVETTILRTGESFRAVKSVYRKR